MQDWLDCQPNRQYAVLGPLVIYICRLHAVATLDSVSLFTVQSLSQHVMSVWTLSLGAYSKREG